MTTPEHVDVLIVGAGLSGIGAACQLREHLPTKCVAILEARDGERRHLGPVPLPRHPLRLRHVHLRLRLAALARRPGAGRRAVDPRLPAHRRRGVRRRRADPLPAPRGPARAGTPRPRAGRSRSTTPATADHDHRRASCGAARGYYDYDEPFAPEFPGADDFAGHDRPPAALARGPRLRRQERRRDRQRRHRGDAGAGDGRHRRPRDDAAALADVRPLPAGPRPARHPARQAADRGCPTPWSAGPTS